MKSSVNSSKQTIRITHMYPKHMSLYGDWGNVRAIEYRLDKMGYQTIIQEVQPGQYLPQYSDFYFMGGGQDKEQESIYEDLLSKKDKLVGDLESGVPMLAICGGYQLLGTSFVTGNNLKLEGLGFFPVETRSPSADKNDRCIGNIKLELQLPGLEGILAIGFENHGGQTTFIDSSAQALGTVINGNGNNSYDKLEGCVKINTIGTYLHGSVLPRNPLIADWLIAKILVQKALSNKSFKIKDSFLINTSIAEANTDHLNEIKF